MFKPFFFIAISLAISSLSIAQPLKRAVAFYDAGTRAAAKGLYPDAILSFKKAIALNKMYDSAYAEMGNAYYKSNKIDSALIHYKNAVAINPKMANVYVTMGHAYRDVKLDFDAAINCYLNALRTDSSNKVIYYSLAWCYNTKKEYEKAIPYAIKALELDNNYRAPYNELAHAYRNTGRYAEAVVQFKKNLAVSVNDLPLYYSGLCYIMLKEKDEALKTYDELLKINPRLAETLKKKIEAPAN